jgi:hypothetical protein
MECRVCGIGKEKGVESFNLHQKKRARELRFHPSRKRKITASSSKKGWNMTIEEIAISSHIRSLDELGEVGWCRGFRGEQGFGPVLVAVRAASMSSCRGGSRLISGFYSWPCLLSEFSDHENAII